MTGKTITYLGYVQGGKCRDTNAAPEIRRDTKGRTFTHYPRTFKQFWVIEELRKLGINAWCGRKIDFYRTGNDRHAKAHESPFLPNYVFVEMRADQFFKATEVNFLAPTFMVVPRREVTGDSGRYGLNRFKSLIDAEYEAAQRVDADSKAAIAQYAKAVAEKAAISEQIKAKYNKAAISEYTKGDLIEATRGPFAEMQVWFNRVVQQGHDQWPRIEGMVEMMGGRVPVLFDPLDVRAAR